MTLRQLTQKLATLERDLSAVRFELIQTKKKANKTNVWQTTAGVLKGNLPKSSVIWQRKIRGEW